MCLPTQNVFKLHLLCHEVVMKPQPHYHMVIEQLL